MYSWNLLQVKTFMNFAKVFTAKIFIEYGGVIIDGLVIILNNGDSVGIMDVASQDPLACKAVFVQQQLPKPPHTLYCRHGSLDQCLPLCSSLAYSSCSRQFNLVHRFLAAHVLLSFSTIRENFNLENLTFSNSLKFSPVKDFHYTVFEIKLHVCVWNLRSQFLSSF